jgi:predicted RNA-binding protein with TRAM domain
VYCSVLYVSINDIGEQIDGLDIIEGSFGFVTIVSTGCSAETGACLGMFVT